MEMRRDYKIEVVVGASTKAETIAVFERLVDDMKVNEWPEQDTFSVESGVLQPMYGITLGPESGVLQPMYGITLGPVAQEGGTIVARVAEMSAREADSTPILTGDQEAT